MPVLLSELHQPLSGDDVHSVDPSGARTADVPIMGTQLTVVKMWSVSMSRRWRRIRMQPAGATGLAIALICIAAASTTLRTYAAELQPVARSALVLEAAAPSTPVVVVETAYLVY